MASTKFYKLNKSSEPLQLLLQDEFRELKENMNGTLIASVNAVGSIVFGAILAYLLNYKINVLEVLLQYFNGNDDMLQDIGVMLQTAVSCAAVYIIATFSMKCIIGKILKWKISLKDLKKTETDINYLKRCFYQKVMNDIITAVSLEKKAAEFGHTPENSETYIQDKALEKVYLQEALFYFGEGVRVIGEKHMFEPSNPKRTEYTNFINSIGKDILISNMDMCIEALQRISGKLVIKTSACNCAEKYIKVFISYKKSIVEQTNC